MSPQIFDQKKLSTLSIYFHNKSSEIFLQAPELLEFLFSQGLSLFLSVNFQFVCIRKLLTFGALSNLSYKFVSSVLDVLKAP